MELRYIRKLNNIEGAEFFMGKSIKDQTEKELSNIELSIQNAYNILLTTLVEKEKMDELTPEQIIKIVGETSLLKEGKICMRFKYDEECKKAKLIVSGTQPSISGKSMDFELDGTALREVIDRTNNKSLSIANKKLEEFAEKGVGEISLSNREEVIRFRRNKENLPYLIGGELSDNDGLTDLQVICPYSTISDMMDLQIQIAEMTPEQVEKFNHKVPPVQVKTHKYRYSKVDGGYVCTVFDFEIDGKKYHVKNDNWSNFADYTVLWEGEEENYPETAIGLTSSYSEYADDQDSVNINSVIEFINQNSNRFSEYLNRWACRADCCGRFPLEHIEEFCKSIMIMDPESILRELKGKDTQVLEEVFIEDVVTKAAEKKALTEKEKKAFDLLSE